jgi:hypothetical protein
MDKISDGQYCLLTNLAKARAVNGILRTLLPREAEGWITGDELIAVLSVVDEWIERMEMATHKAMDNRKEVT